MGKEPNSQIEKRSRNAGRKRRAQISTRTNSDGLVSAVPSKKEAFFNHKITQKKRKKRMPNKARVVNDKKTKI